MAAISRAFAPPPRLFRTKPPPAFDEDDERGLPPDADDDDAAAHAVIAEHTAHRTNCADGGCTNTVPHPRCCGVPVHVILGMIKVCSISFFNCGFGRKRSSLGRISSLKKRFSRTTQQRQQRPAERERKKRGRLHARRICPPLLVLRASLARALRIKLVVRGKNVIKVVLPSSIPRTRTRTKVMMMSTRKTRTRTTRHRKKSLAPSRRKKRERSNS